MSSSALGSCVNCNSPATSSLFCKTHAICNNPGCKLATVFHACLQQSGPASAPSSLAGKKVAIGPVPSNAPAPESDPAFRTSDVPMPPVKWVLTRRGQLLTQKDVESAFSKGSNAALVSQQDAYILHADLKDKIKSDFAVLTLMYIDARNTTCQIPVLFNKGTDGIPKLYFCEVENGLLILKRKIGDNVIRVEEFYGQPLDAKDIATLLTTINTKSQDTMTPIVDQIRRLVPADSNVSYQAVQLDWLDDSIYNEPAEVMEQLFDSDDRKGKVAVNAFRNPPGDEEYCQFDLVMRHPNGSMMTIPILLLPEEGSSNFRLRGYLKAAHIDYASKETVPFQYYYGSPVLVEGAPRKNFGNESTIGWLMKHKKQALLTIASDVASRMNIANNHSSSATAPRPAVDESKRPVPAPSPAASVLVTGRSGYSGSFAPTGSSAAASTSAAAPKPPAQNPPKPAPVVGKYDGPSAFQPAPAQPLASIKLSEKQPDLERGVNNREIMLFSAEAAKTALMKNPIIGDFIINQGKASTDSLNYDLYFIDRTLTCTCMSLSISIRYGTVSLYLNKVNINTYPLLPIDPFNSGERSRQLLIAYLKGDFFTDGKFERILNVALQS